MRLPKPIGKSQLCLRGDIAINAGTVYYKVHHSSMDIGLSDCLFVFAIPNVRINGICSFVVSKYNSGKGFQIYLWPDNSLDFGLGDGASAVIHYRTPAASFSEGDDLLVFVALDRDGLIKIIINSVEKYSGSAAASNVDQDNTTIVQLLYENMGAKIAGLDIFHYEQWNFGVGGLPSLADIQSIVAEYNSNPYATPATLDKRPGKATELRMLIDGEEDDLESTLVHDKSAYGNHLTIAGGKKCKNALVEAVIPPVIFRRDEYPEYGISDGNIDQQDLPGISIGTSDLIIEVFLKNFKADKAVQKQFGSTSPYYLYFGDNTAANFFTLSGYITGVVFGGSCGLTGGVYPIWDMITEHLHIFKIVRATTHRMLMNGHAFASEAKNAHNVDSKRMWFFSNHYVAGEFSPSIGCVLRVYSGNFSGISDDEFLAIHRGNLGTPYVTPKELLEYENFRFTGRDSSGKPIKENSTVVYNEKTGGTLLIQNSKLWSQICVPVWVPR